MQGINTFFYILVLIMSVVVHEVAHGYAADAQGDPTARYAGRLTLNPLKHIDMMGSIIIPLLLVLFQMNFIVGWAKPVPYIEANLRDKRWGTVIVASAGIISNFGLAIAFGILIRCSFLLGPFAAPFVSIAMIIVFVNIILGFFNLIPIPPLDGSKIFFNLIPEKYFSAHTKNRFEYYSFPILVIFIFFFWHFLFPVIGLVFSFLTGLPSPI